VDVGVKTHVATFDVTDLELHPEIALLPTVKLTVPVAFVAVPVTIVAVIVAVSIVRMTGVAVAAVIEGFAFVGTTVNAVDVDESMYVMPL
jgi:hypothetical protein